MVTASLGDVSTARFLIENGAELNAVDSMGRTALHIAVLWGRLEMVELLCQYSLLDLNAKTAHDHNAVELALLKQRFDIYHVLIGSGSEESTILMEDIIQDDGTSAVSLADETEQDEILLLDRTESNDDLAQTQPSFDRVVNDKVGCFEQDNIAADQVDDEIKNEADKVADEATELKTGVNQVDELKNQSDQVIETKNEANQIENGSSQVNEVNRESVQAENEPNQVTDEIFEQDQVHAMFLVSKENSRPQGIFGKSEIIVDQSEQKNIADVMKRAQSNVVRKRFSVFKGLGKESESIKPKSFLLLEKMRLALKRK